MHQRRIEKPKPQLTRLGHYANNTHTNSNPRFAEPQPGNESNQSADKETHAALATLTGMVEKLTDKVEALQRTQIATTELNPSDRLSCLLNGRSSGLVNVLSSLITVVPLFGTLAFWLLGRLPLPPGTAPAWSVWDVIRPLLPMAAAIALVLFLILASRLMKRKSLRISFITTVMICYGVAAVFYLAWLSLGFLRFNTLPGGVLLTLTWVAIVSILRRAPTEVGEMREQARLQLEKEEKTELM